MAESKIQIEPVRRDTAGDLVLHASRIIAGLSLLGALTILLVVALAVHGTLLLVALCLFGVCLSAIVWVAFWSNFKRVADDVYVIRQHLESLNRANGNASDSSSADDDDLSL